MSLQENYDTIAKAKLHEVSKLLPFRKYVEEYTLFKLLGNIEGKKVLDLACGGGHYTRILKEKSAAEVIGVDISPSMIQLAKDEESRNPVGCHYVCFDAADLDIIGEFDYAIGIYLCCNADTKDKMTLFAKNIYKNLKVGGSFVGIEKTNFQNPSDELSVYGVYHDHKVPLNEGDRLGVSFKNHDGTTFTLQTHFWQKPTYSEAFINAGFSSFQWKGPWLDSDLPSDKPVKYWDKFMNVKGVIGMVAVK